MNTLYVNDRYGKHRNIEKVEEDKPKTGPIKKTKLINHWSYV